MDNNRLTELAYKYTSETLTQAEGRELAGMLGQEEYQQLFQQLIHQQMLSGALTMEPADEKSGYRIEQRVIQQIGDSDKTARTIPLGVVDGGLMPLH